VIWLNQCLYTLLKKLSARSGGVKKGKEKEEQSEKE
jgi:hypothetical protein